MSGPRWRRAPEPTGLSLAVARSYGHRRRRDQVGGEPSGSGLHQIVRFRHPRRCVVFLPPFQTNGGEVVVWKKEMTSLSLGRPTGSDPLMRKQAVPRDLHVAAHLGRTRLMTPWRR